MLLVDALRRRKRQLLLGLCGAAVYLSTLLTVPLISRSAIDALVRSDTRPIGTAAAALVGLGLLRAAAGALRKYNGSKLMALVGNDLRQDVHRQILQLSPSDQARFGAGQLLARATSDVTLIEQFLGSTPLFAQSLLIGIGGAVLMLVVAPLLAAAVLVVIAVAVPCALVLARPMRPSSRETQRLIGDYATFIEQHVHGIQVVHGHGLDHESLSKGVALTSSLQRASLTVGQQRARFVAGFLSIPGLASVTVLGVGGSLALRGDLGAGDLFAFFQYLGLLIIPIFIGAQVIGLLPQVLAAAERVAELMPIPSSVSSAASGVPFPKEPPDLRLEHVWAGYSTSDPILCDVTLHVPAGSTVALVGGAGTGKSTLLRVAAGLLVPSQGAVTIGGITLADIAEPELRSCVAVAFDEPYLLGATVHENLSLGRPALSDEDISAALEASAATDFVADLPDGLSTELSGQGSSLSGGQRQRLALARALARRAPVVLLDDPTSALDPRTAERVHHNLKAVLAGRTCVLVASRLETALLADLVAVVEAGRVVAFGSHDELADDERYRAALGLPQLSPCEGQR
jgi:ATP-binding cassette subfamily B protein